MNISSELTTPGFSGNWVEGPGYARLPALTSCGGTPEFFPDPHRTSGNVFRWRESFGTYSELYCALSPPILACVEQCTGASPFLNSVPVHRLSA